MICILKAVGTYEADSHFSVSLRLADIFRDILYTSYYSEKTQMMHLKLKILNNLVSCKLDL